MSSVHLKSYLSLVCFLFILLSSLVLSAQNASTQKQQSLTDPSALQDASYIQNTWTWIGGDQTSPEVSVYGVLGQTSSLNKPGTRVFGISWTDSAGVMWLFGGNGVDSAGTSAQLNDLWKFDGQNWTWVGGSKLSGQKSNYGTLSTTTSTNWPGARDNAATWYVDGILWLFGGYGIDNNNNLGWLNDLWKFDGTNWTWMGSGTTNNVAGVYGTKELPNFSNLPGSRISTNRWVDTQGNKWLFGGEGFDINGNLGRLNDLWKLDIAGRWTWVSGDNTNNSAGNYGAKNVASASNKPGARTAAATWLGENNLFYLFGGFGFDKDGTLNNLNDLWTFDGSNWTWINGSDSVNAAGVYGTFNVTSETNYPGARRWPAYVQVSSNEVYLFGGGGADNTGFTGWLDDLWKWDGQNWTWIRGSSFRTPSPVFGEKFVPNLNNRAPARDASAFWLDANKNLVVFGGYGRNGSALANLNDLWRYTLQPNNTINLTFTPAGGNTVTAGTQVQITANQQNTTIYYTLDGSTPTTSSAVYTTPITISVTSTIKAIGVKSGFDNSTITSAIFTVLPTTTDFTTAKGQFTWVAGDDSLNLLPSYKNQSALSQLALDPELLELIETGSNDIPEEIAQELAMRAIKANHGTKGVASASNTPGSRNLAQTWTDENGILWLFGGIGINPNLIIGRFNDLWSFDGQLWTWVGGSNQSNQAGTYAIKNNPSAENWPGGRSATSMVKNQLGEIYLFGGTGFDVNGSLGSLNDLWKWDGEYWTWLSGSNTINQHGIYNTKGTASSSSMPGARSSSTLGVFENGDLWLFGGNGYASNSSFGRLNDLWKWDGTNWTWLAGNNSINSVAVYGTKTVADSLNTPSARDFIQGWTDKNDAVWIFGGQGFDSSSNLGLLNEVWKWDGTNWTWMAGDNTVNAADNYGTKGQVATSNTPSARNFHSLVQDNNGAVWLFGGNSLDSQNSFRTNTLWKWDGINWTWVAGSNAKNQPAIFGTKGQPNSLNQPSARSSTHLSFDAKNNLIWIYGGFGASSNGVVGRLNDLWVFEPEDKDLIKPVSITVNELSSSVSQVILASETPGLTIYFTLDGSTPTSSSTVYSVPFTISETTHIKAIGIQNNNLSTVLSEKRIVINPVPSTLQTAENQWTWFGGSNTANASGVYKESDNFSQNTTPLNQGDVVVPTNMQLGLNSQKGVYGEMGIKDASNIPGARYGGGTWKDSNNNLWLFGGNGVDSEGNTGYLNDLWVYDGNFWTWMGGSKVRNQQLKTGVKGVASTNSWPGGVEIPKLAQDSNGHVYLFGGFTYDPSNNLGRTNLLWMWDGQHWTWLSGSIQNDGNPSYGTKGTAVSTNIPGARSIPTIWVDEQNNLVVFGGNGFDGSGSEGSLNDLWKWDGQNWTWIGGSNQINTTPNFGDKNIPSSMSWPGATRGAISWKDAKNDIFIFGGFGVDSTATLGNLNTMWRWDGQNWTWMGGDKTADSEGVSSELGVRNSTNWPSSRYFATAEIDPNGQVLLIGGRSNGTTYNNDTWSWDGEEWAWIHGELNVTTNISYGTLNQPSTTNNPGSRYIHSSWIDRDNKLILFGGFDGSITRRNDLWAYQQETVVGRTSKTANPTFSVSTGTYTDSVRVTIASETPNSTFYYTLDGSVPTTSSAVYEASILFRETATLRAIARSNVNLSSEVVTATYTINYSKEPLPVFTPSAGTYNDSVLVTITAQTPGATIYYTTREGGLTVNSPQYSQPILIKENTLIRAFVTAPFKSSSNIASAEYVITNIQAPQAPVISPRNSSFIDSVLVSISNQNAADSILYTLDGSTPTLASKAYLAPFWVNPKSLFTASELKVQDTIVVKAVAFNAANIASALDSVSLSYSISPNALVINAPIDNTTITLEQDLSTQLLVQWTSSAVHGTETVSYQWKLYTDTATNAQVILQSNPLDSLETQLSLTHQQLQAILTQNNIDQSDSLKLYHRVTASNGSSAQKQSEWASFFVKSNQENNPPEPVSIVSPNNNSFLTLAGNPESLLTIAWNTPVDSDNDTLTYEWQLSKAESFNPGDLVTEVKDIQENFYSISYKNLSQFSDAAGINTGEQTVLFHRINTSDGKSYVTGNASLIIFLRNTLTSIESDNELPEETTLFQNYPNPFNPSTTINYAIVGTEMVNLSVYAIDGTLIETLVNSVQSTGTYSKTFNAVNLPTGVYVYRLQTSRVTSVKKMLLIK